MFNRRELLRKTPVAAIATILGLSSLTKAKAEDSEGDFNREENFLDWAMSLEKSRLTKRKILYAQEEVDGTWYITTENCGFKTLEEFANHYTNSGLKYNIEYTTFKGNRALKVTIIPSKNSIQRTPKVFYNVEL